MDEIRRLERQIRELQRELEAQNAQVVRMRQEMADENLIRLNRYRDEMKDKLKQHDKETQKEYERLLKEYEKSANREIREKELQLNQEYQALLARTKQKEQEWLQKTKELEQLILELKTGAHEKEENSANEAYRYAKEAGEVYKEIDKKPHEKFFPKRIQNFKSAMKEANDLFRVGLYEAAIAISVSARSGLNRLGYEIDDEIANWKHQYYVFKNKTELMYTKMTQELKTWKEFSMEDETEVNALERKGLQNDINFWSRGEWEKISGKISACRKDIAKVEGYGIDDYLKMEEGLSVEQMEKRIQELDELEKQYDHLVKLYKSRYSASCERADWGEKMIDFLVDEINLIWLEEKTHYKLYEGDDEAYAPYMEAHYGSDYQREDVREWLELTFENAVGSIIYIYIVPYEKNDNVENRLVVYIDYEGPENIDYSRQIYVHIQESIGISDDDGTIQFATDVTQLTTNMNLTLRETGKALEQKIKEKNN